MGIAGVRLETSASVVVMDVLQPLRGYHVSEVADDAIGVHSRLLHATEV